MEVLPVRADPKPAHGWRPLAIATRTMSRRDLEPVAFIFLRRSDLSLFTPGTNIINHGLEPLPKIGVPGNNVTALRRPAVDYDHPDDTAFANLETRQVIIVLAPRKSG